MAWYSCWRRKPTSSRTRVTRSAPNRTSLAKVHIVKGPLIAGVIQVIKRKRLKKIGFESGWTQFDAYQRLKERLPLGVSLVPVGRVIEERRMVKSAAEIDTIRRSVNLNSEAFARVLKRIRPGVRELDVAAEIEFQMKMLGAEKPSFDTIIAAGPNSALPHSHPTGHQIGANELLLIDMGASLEGYASDMTRVIHLGASPKRSAKCTAPCSRRNWPGSTPFARGPPPGKSTQPPATF